MRASELREAREGLILTVSPHISLSRVRVRHLMQICQLAEADPGWVWAWA